MKNRFTKEDIADGQDLSGGEWIDTNTILAVFEGNRELTIKHRDQLINILDNERTTIIRKVQLIVELFREVLDSAVEELKVKKE